MTEPFRTRIEAPQESEIDLRPTPPRDLPSDTLEGFETKASDPLTKEQLNLDIWEGEHKTKYITEFFNIKEYAEEFNLKMQTSVIDKYIKGELEKRQYEKNTENWEKILQEIEEEIGSKPMELFSRIKKIVGYINVVNRLKKLKDLKDSYSTP